ncbi:MAG: cyanophycinase [Bacteroidales bacterium]
MQKNIIALLLVTLLLSCQQSGDAFLDPSAPKGGLFIIGGGERPDALVMRMIEEAGVQNEGYVIILPMASELPDSAIIWSSEQFIAHGVKDVFGFNFQPDADIPPQWIDSLRRASLIYMSGGDQNKFMAIVKGNAIEEAIWDAYKSGAIIAGTSAGAAVMSYKMITGNELRNPDYRSTFRTIEAENMELDFGLGFLETAVIDQHFIWRSRHNRLFTLIMEYPQFKGIGIDESTAILVRGNQAEVVGISQVMVFSNPDNSYRQKNHKLGASNLVVDIYLPGEKFTF